VTMHNLRKALILALGPHALGASLGHSRVRVGDNRLRVHHVNLSVLLNALDEEIIAPNLKKEYHV